MSEQIKFGVGRPQQEGPAEPSGWWGCGCAAQCRCWAGAGSAEVLWQAWPAVGTSRCLRAAGAGSCCAGPLLAPWAVDKPLSVEPGTGVEARLLALVWRPSQVSAEVPFHRAAHSRWAGRCWPGQEVLSGLPFSEVAWGPHHRQDLRLSPPSLLPRNSWSPAYTLGVHGGPIRPGLAGGGQWRWWACGRATPVL